MKLSLDTIGYGGYFTAPGEQLPLEDAVRRAAQFGYDAACIYAHRPLGFPLDLDRDRRERLKALYGELDLEMGAIVCCTSFLEANHVLLYPQEKEILYVRECIRLAKDLGASIVRILAGFYGYFQNPFAGQGYGLPSFESRSRRVSRGEDWLEAWHQVQRGIREVALYAQDEGITLALQTHPEITMNDEDTLELLAEINVPSLKVGLDLPLIESPDPQFVRRTVPRMKGLMVYSHTISLRQTYTVGGAPAGWEEVTPGDKWEAEKGSGTFCAEHPPGRGGKRYLTPFPPLPQSLPGDRLRGVALRRTVLAHHPGTPAWHNQARGRALRGVARLPERVVAVMSSKWIALICLVPLCLIGVSPAAVPDPDIGWWKFDEGAGDTTADSSGKGHPGTIQGAAWVDGGWNGLGWCLDFDGNDDRVELGIIDVQGTGITLAAWINPDSFNINDGRVISKANEWGENDHWWMLSTINQSFLRFRWKTQGQATTTLIASQGALKLGEWQHAAATWDGARMRLYRNATEVASRAKAGNAVATDPAVRAAIASQPKGAYATDPLHANKFFDGRIDEVRLYSSALSQAQWQESIQGLSRSRGNPTLKTAPRACCSHCCNGRPPIRASRMMCIWAQAPIWDPSSGWRPGRPWRCTGMDLLFEPGATYYWRVDEIDAAGNVATGKVWSFLSASLTTYKPQPADGAKWVDPQAPKLGWSAGMNALTHDIYFGRSKQDVAAGTGDTLKKSEELANVFEPGVLEAGATYYWRVDENLLDGSKKTGPVWSFTTRAPGGGLKGEYYSNLDLTGSPILVRGDPGVNFAWGTAGPGKPLPGSGYSVRWSGDLEAAFTETYTIYVYADDGVKLWFNGELVVDKWFGQETGSPKYAVKVALEAGQRYPIVMEYFFNSGTAAAELSWESPHTPAQIIPAGALSLLLRAHSPNPSQHAVNVRQTPVLSWRVGEKATKHDVYFGADREAVAKATTADTVIYQGRQKLEATTFEPEALEWNKTYFWRVDEVNEAGTEGPWTGSVWDFTTANFVVVDDMEAYIDEEGNRIYETWVDGWTNSTGSLVGYLEAREGTFGERQTVYGGRQSMPLVYDNTKAPNCSEAERTWAKPQDWTVNGVNTLVLHVKGKTDNGPDPLYVVLEDSAGHVGVVAHPDARIALSTMWNEWAIPLSDFSPAGVNAAAIKKMSIGVGKRAATAPGGTGMLFIDDIWVRKP